MRSLKHKPFKFPPLRQPGQSLREGIRDRFAAHAGVALVILVMIGFSLGIITAIVLTSLGFWPLIGIALANMTIAVVAAAWIIRRLDAGEIEDQHALLGIEGERIVADALDDLKRDGYRVFHDVPPERDAREGESLANFDHVVIGPAGVFVIETKTRIRADRDDEVVVQADGRLMVNGVEPDRCPIKQVKALRGAIKTMLERQTAMRAVFVRAVVIFPGWFINDAAYRQAGGDVWTLNEKAFNKWVRHPKEGVRLTADQVALLSSRLEDHVRSASASLCKA